MQLKDDTLILFLIRSNMEKHYRKGSKKGCLVFLHGNSSSTWIFNNQLNDKSIPYDMLAFDLHGHGESRGFSLEKGRFSVQCKNVLIEEINKIEDDIFLIGNSLGGHYAIEIASQIKNLKGLMIFGTAPLKNPINVDEAFLPSEALGIFLNPTSSDDGIKKSIAMMLHQKQHVDALTNNFKKTNPIVRSELLHEISNNLWENQWEIFIELKVPRFIVLSDNDPTINPTYIKQLKELSGDNCFIHQIKDCGHFPTIEQPKKFSEILNKTCKLVFV